MTITDIQELNVGDRIQVRIGTGGSKSTRRLPPVQNATVIDRPSEHHARALFGFLWVRVDGAGIDEVRQLTIPARDIVEAVAA